MYCKLEYLMNYYEYHAFCVYDMDEIIFDMFLLLFFLKFIEVFPQPFEGAKVVINKGLNQGFQVSHSLTLGSITPSGYRFGATYVGTNMISPTEPGLVLMGEMDPSGNLNAQGVHFVSEAVKLKFGTQVSLK